MKILITGGSGFIGKNIINELSIDNDIVIVGRSNSNALNNKPISSSIYYFQSDYSTGSLRKILSETKTDAVIHLAALRPLKKGCIQDFFCNLNITVNLLDACLYTGVARIINFSSQHVYSAYNKQPWLETDKPLPASNYGISKLWGENACDFYTLKGLQIITPRIAQVIGIGEREEYVLHQYLYSAMSKNPLSVFGKGLGKRQYIYVKDIANFVALALKTSGVNGAFNVGMTENYSFMELAQTINKVFNNPTKIIQNNEVGADENNYYMCIEKAQTQLNWQPQFDLLNTYLDIKNDLNNGNY